MKRTISEIIDLIKQKKESAMNNLAQTTKTYVKAKMIGANCEECIKDGAKITGYIEAYKDVLSLLESSHLVEQEKALKMLKEAFNIDVEKIEKGIFVSYKLTPHKRCRYLSPEEYKFFKEVLKDE